MARLMPTEGPAKLAVALASPAAKSVSGQIFAVQGNDIAVMSQIRSVDYREKEGGWSPESILDEALPALAPSFTPFGGGMATFTRPAQAVGA